MVTCRLGGSSPSLWVRVGGLDGFGGILFADENFQETQFGFDPLVLPVLLQHGHPVLLLHISTAQQGTGFSFMV